MKSIERLPEAVQSSMRSGVVICDLTRIVEELVLNSIEAAATEVSVAVGVASCYVKVVDNGSGITRDGLVLLGERYATSKFDPLDVMHADSESFDFHGETLRSISDISLLEIVTKARGKPNGYRKIMKNRKCLFISISDDRLDAGTTVTVREVFYNQPVRRKHMKSSPKVLDSVKMCVLRIALVHVNVSFKVVDVESGSELLNTGPSRPPLSILFSNFRVENLGALYTLNISNGALNLSGHISAPGEDYSVKVIQYIYINSRFICKGPIHKLLNQLATKFVLLNSTKTITGTQGEKRNKCQMGPTFILNLSCPRSYYDIIASEPSRTSVEFKDWGPVLTCIENGVTNLWTENISHDKPVTLESGRKRCKRQSFQTSVCLGTPQLKKLPENYDTVHGWEECMPDHRKTSTTVSAVKKHQSDAVFWPDTDHFSRSRDGSVADYGVLKHEESSSRQYPCCVFSSEYYDLMESSSDKQDDDVSLPNLEDFLPKIDDDTNDILGWSGTSVDCLTFGDDEHINQYSRKSSLRSCSFQGSFLHDITSGSDDRSEFKSDDMRIKKKLVDCDESIVDDICAVFNRRDTLCSKARSRAPPFQASPATRYDTYEGSEFMIRDSANSSKILNNIINDSSKQFLKCKSSLQSFGSGWCPMTAEQIVGKKFWESEVGRGSEFDKDKIHGYFTRREDGYFTRREDDDSIGGNLSLRGSWLQQSYSNFLDQKKGIVNHDWDAFENYPSGEHLETFSKTDWSTFHFPSEKTSRNYSVPSLDNTPSFEHKCGKPDGRTQETESNRKKNSVRSRSAPPFCRGEKKFLGLGYSSRMSARNSCQFIGQTPFPTGSRSLNHAQLHGENVNLRPELERTSETIKIQDGRSQKKEQLTSMETVGSVDFQEIHDPFESGQKWRSYCLPTGEHVRCDNKDQEPILDLSSDSFHLIGDSLVPKSIDKTSLDDAKVLNQVDKKFIAVVAGKTLAVIDQHAADERIRLEELRHKVLSGEMKTIRYLHEERELILPEIGHQLLHNYAEQIQKWGWICNITQDTGSFTKSLDSLHRTETVAKLLAVPCIVDTNLTDIDLLEFLQQLADTDGSSTIPPSVHRILNSKACRGAIMFGDALLPSECSLIVEELKQTSMCFQCAHGRPTTVPLVNLEVLHDMIAELGSLKSWHGLHQHKVDIRRSEQRLSSAIC